jgi:hypothetical protein
MSTPTGITPASLALGELVKARDANDARRDLAAELRAGKLRTDDLDREVADKSLEIASIATALAAIEAGPPPGCCRCAPDREEGR